MAYLRFIMNVTAMPCFESSMLGIIYSRYGQFETLIPAHFQVKGVATTF